VQAAVSALQQIFDEGKLADRVVQPLLKSNKKWGSKDRKFIASNVYDVVRWYRLYYEALGRTPQTALDWYHLLATKWYLAGEELPDWEEFASLDKAAILARHAEVTTVRKIKASIPDWLDELGQKELGSQWDATLHASNQLADLTIRVNTMLTTPDKLIKHLEKQNVVAQKTNTANALIIPTRQKITHLQAFKKGWFEVQDLSSQWVAPLLNPKPNSLVIDACAGAGGKSLHLANLIKNKGKVIAMDITASKLQELQKRAKRANSNCIYTQTIKNTDTVRNSYDKADYLLLDVPCSGLGTLRRNPNIKWHLSPSFVSEIRATQQSILKNYTKMCKIGGKVVYATCSILPSENEEQIQQFLKADYGQGFQLLQDKSILPQDGVGDGFYMALLERTS
jgi:16S rRNA (cytosine967-C5)-methyltransferase